MTWRKGIHYSMMNKGTPCGMAESGFLSFVLTKAATGTAASCWQELQTYVLQTVALHKQISDLRLHAGKAMVVAPWLQHS